MHTHGTPRLTWKQVLSIGSLVAVATAVSSCSDLSFVQRHSPANPYKDYKKENAASAAVVGMGEPISARTMTANATFSLTGNYSIEDVLQKMAGTYNVAIRWGNGIRRDKRVDITMNGLTFDEARNYVEDVYDIQIIKEGERRLLVLPSASEPRLSSFNPGQNVTLAKALKGLAEQCSYNLVINENKEQLSSIRVTTNLKNITCYDAFDALLNPHGLSLSGSGDYYTVTGLPQRQWTVNLYEPKRSEQIQVNYASDFSSGGGSDSESSSSSSGSQSAGGSNKVNITYERDLWKDLKTDLEALVKNGCVSGVDSSVQQYGGESAAQLLPPPTGATQDTSLVTPMTGGDTAAHASKTSGSSGSASEASACGYVNINESVGLVQMRAARAVLDQANEVIQRVQDIASRRLLLEARVLAVSRSRAFNQKGGITYNGATGTGAQNTALGAASTGSIASALSRVLNDYGTGANSFALGGMAVKNQNLDLVMSLLEQYGTTYELMHPMMELMDRQRATLIDGRNEKYFIIKSTTDSSSGAVTTSTNVEEKNQFLGLQFSAAAQISDNGNDPHTVSLQIPITSLAKTVNVPSGVSGSIAGVAPVANTRLIDQKVRIRDGEIKVIGGLTKTIAIDTESGVPLFRDLMAIGKLANEEGVTYENVEFVILLQVKRLN